MAKSLFTDIAFIENEEGHVVVMAMSFKGDVMILCKAN